MVRMSVLADCLKTISNAEKRGRRQVLIRPSSKVVIKFLQKMQEHGKSLVAMEWSGTWLGIASAPLLWLLDEDPVLLQTVSLE